MEKFKSNKYKFLGIEFSLLDIVMVVLGLLLLVISAVISHHHQLVGWQKKLFIDINNWPNYYKTPALIITEALGAAYPIIVVVLLPLLFKNFKLAWKFYVTVGAAGVIMEIAKHVVKEPRPFVMLSGHLHLRAVETGLTSYPSGHVAVATAMALTLWLILPNKFKFLSVLWILLVSISRLYLGVHTPLDIVGGFSIGLLSFYAVKLLPKSFAKKVYLD